MAYNYNPAYPPPAASDPSRLEAYSYYYQNFYGVQQNNSQDAAAYFSTATNGQAQPGNVYNYFGTQYNPYPTAQEFQSAAIAPSVLPTRPTPKTKTVGGRSRSPVERVLRYRLDDNETSSSLNESKYSKNAAASRPNKRALPDNRDYISLNKRLTSANTINEAMLLNNAEERRNIELQLNEAMFFDRLFEVNFKSSWYKLKKKNEDGTELVCVVVEIIDCNNKVYKVYGGYTSNIRSKELAFGQAIKKLNAILEEQEKEKLEKAKQVIANAIVTNTALSSLPLTLVPNPLFQSSTLNTATTASTYGQQYSQPAPPGTESETCEYDPVNYAYGYQCRQQPVPPGTEKNFYEIHDGSIQKEQPVAEVQSQSSQENQQQESNTTSTGKVVDIDRPCSGRGDYEDKFTKKAREMGYIFRCVRNPPKKHFNTDFFVFELQFAKPNEPRTKKTVAGSSLRDEGNARESVYAMALDQLEKIDKKQSKTSNAHIEYDCDWITPIPSSLSLPKSYTSIQKAAVSNESSFEPMRKTIEAPNWNWESTSNDLSIMKSTPIFSMGRGKPKNSNNISAPGGGILDHREWRWPAYY